jgi:hypothetical protein
MIANKCKYKRCSFQEEKLGETVHFAITCVSSRSKSTSSSIRNFGTITTMRTVIIIKHRLAARVIKQAAETPEQSNPLLLMYTSFSRDLLIQYPLPSPIPHTLSELW